MPGQGKGQRELVGGGVGAGRLLFVYAKCGARVKVKAKAREVLGVLVQPCTALRGPIRPAWGSLVRSTTESGGGAVELSDKVLPILQGPVPPPPPISVLSFCSVSWRVMQERETEARRQERLL